jgi:hypothetical protein
VCLLFPSLTVLSSGGLPESQWLCGGSMFRLGVDPVNHVSGHVLVSGLTVARHLRADSTRSGRAARLAKR